MSSIFSKIIKGEIPAYKVAETEDFLAFLDINPNTEGHTLCIPKIEVDRILDLDTNTYTQLMLFARKVGKAIEACIPCNRVGISVIGLEVPHVHIHLIPLHSMSDMGFKKKVSLNVSEFKSIAKKINLSYKAL